MTFIIANYCPNCGAPIWIQEPSPIQGLPSPAYFSCSCKPEKTAGIDLQKKLETLEVEINWLKGTQLPKKRILGD